MRGIGSIAAGLPQSIHKDSEEPNLLAKRHRSVIFMTELTTVFIIAPIFCFHSIFTSTLDRRNILRKKLP